MSKVGRRIRREEWKKEGKKESAAKEGWEGQERKNEPMERREGEKGGRHR